MCKPRAMAPRLLRAPISISSQGNLSGCGGPPPVTGGPGRADALVFGMAVGLAVQLAGLVMRLVSNVTAPYRARARPGRMFAPVVRLMLVSASRFP
jgi:hypothetical protein